MSKAPLLACPACSRHIRADEGACPFCQTEVPSAFREAATSLSPSVRLSRAALYAVGVGTISLSAACGGATKSGSEADGGGRDALTVDSSSGDSSATDSSMGLDTGNSAVPYGQPVRDSGTFPDADADAGELPDSPPPFDGPAPPYGQPPPQDS